METGKLPRSEYKKYLTAQLAKDTKLCAYLQSLNQSQKVKLVTERIGCINYEIQHLQ